MSPPLRRITLAVALFVVLAAGCALKSSAQSAPAHRSSQATSVTSTGASAETAIPASGGAQGPTAQATPAAMDQALRRAEDFLARLEPQPHLYLFLDVFYRRFGVSRFADSLARYDALLKEVPPVALPAVRALRRLMDPNNALDPESGYPCQPTVDLFTCPALYCDRLPAPSSYADLLHKSLTAGPKDVTHVALAMMEARDLGCPGFIPDDVQKATIDGMAKLVALDGRVTDLELEAATFLTYLGRGDLVPGGFAKEVLATQRPAGGWAYDSARRDRPAEWHPSCLGYWYLLESRPSAAARPPMVAGR